MYKWVLLHVLNQISSDEIDQKSAFSASTSSYWHIYMASSIDIPHSELKWALYIFQVLNHSQAEFGECLRLLLFGLDHRLQQTPKKNRVSRKFMFVVVWSWPSSPAFHSNPIWDVSKVSPMDILNSEFTCNRLFYDDFFSHNGMNVFKDSSTDVSNRKFVGYCLFFGLMLWQWIKTSQNTAL